MWYRWWTCHTHTHYAPPTPPAAALDEDLKRAQHRADEVRRKARDWEREARSVLKPRDSRVFELT